MHLKILTSDKRRKRSPARLSATRGRRFGRTVRLAFESLEDRRLLAGVPALSISDVTVVEGDDARWDANFKVSLSAPTDQEVRVYFETADGTAVSGSDYLAGLGGVHFAPGGPLSQTISIPVVGDTVQENHEYFFVNLSDPVNATLRDGQGEGTILDADPLRGSIVQLTNNDTDDRLPVIDSGQVAWVNWASYDIFLYDGATTRQLSDAQSAGSYPDIDNGQVAWATGNRGVYLYDGTSTRQLVVGNELGAFFPHIDEGQVTWFGWISRDSGDDYEMFIYDGTTTRQLTDNTFNDWWASIDGGQIVWGTSDSGYASAESEVYLYDGTSIRRLTDNSYADALPDIDDGTVVWFAEDGGYNTDIYLYDGTATRRLTNDDILGASGARIDNGQVAFSGVGPNLTYDIYLYDGASVRPLSTTAQD